MTVNFRLTNFSIFLSIVLYYLASKKASTFDHFSTTEIEDILSCDDVALNDVYQYHTPPLRRLPPLLWVRIQADLEGFLATSGDGGIQVTRWYHGQFKTVATQQYLSDESRRFASIVAL